jgi:acetylornithine deacetylase/succinyl-diaminopimelate desuccinylase-like protein
VHVADDRVSNASWAIQGAQANGSFGVYFEGTNILVKVDGTDPDYRVRGGVLFSAHYDSVSTAPGVTDDGMGVATLLDMVKYLAVKQPRRTAVFNINNGEEDGLHGAHV